MGQSQSHTEKDLKNTNDMIFNQKVIFLTIAPFYIINTEDFEYNLSTGNDKLDDIVTVKVTKCLPYFKELFKNNFEYETLVSFTNNNKIYLTVEKTNNETFSSNDCEFIRNFFDKYNKDEKKLTVICEDEATLSPFFEDLGDIKLGFNIEQIDYI